MEYENCLYKRKINICQAMKWKGDIETLEVLAGKKLVLLSSGKNISGIPATGIKEDGKVTAVQIGDYIVFEDKIRVYKEKDFLETFEKERM